MINKSATHNHHLFKVTIAQGKAKLHINEKHNDIWIRAITLEMFMKLGRNFQHQKPKNVGVRRSRNKTKISRRQQMRQNLSKLGHIIEKSLGLTIYF